VGEVHLLKDGNGGAAGNQRSCADNQ
jgi:hypothetical protein